MLSVTHTSGRPRVLQASVLLISFSSLIFDSHIHRTGSADDLREEPAVLKIQLSSCAYSVYHYDAFPHQLVSPREILIPHQSNGGMMVKARLGVLLPMYVIACRTRRDVLIDNRVYVTSTF